MKAENNSSFIQKNLNLFQSDELIKARKKKRDAETDQARLENAIKRAEKTLDKEADEKKEKLDIKINTNDGEYINEYDVQEPSLVFFKKEFNNEQNRDLWNQAVKKAKRQLYEDFDGFVDDTFEMIIGGLQGATFITGGASALLAGGLKITGGFITSAIKAGSKEYMRLKKIEFEFNETMKEFNDLQKVVMNCFVLSLDED